MYLGPAGVLTGTARVNQEAEERAKAERDLQEHGQRVRNLEAKQKARAAQIAALQAEAESEAAEITFTRDYETRVAREKLQSREQMARLRGGLRNENRPTKS